ncbi:hypothetical protein [Phyllobacterium sp. P30BS-XVII]|uniref:hypothetical protein n=1 Tax=Phyllobacterium sp. P30BS-XVII TaxID=2587046 RepID=UPI0015F851E3|nr:hypothetical protein [Phyllobacterium sp. P30BS-XVII]MBA8902204.1 hypothetical protein [Phyllobacterium sp. P30BS-XVII]
MNAFAQLETFQIVQDSSDLPPCGEMSDRTEGGVTTSTNIAVAEYHFPLPRPLLRLAIDEVAKTGDPKGNAEVLVLVV